MKSATDELGESRSEVEELRTALAASEEEIVKAKKQIEKFAFDQGDDVSETYDRSVANPIPFTPGIQASAKTGQAILNPVIPTDTPKVWTASGVNLSERQLKILTLLTEDRYFFPAQIAERLKLTQFWADFDLEELEKLKFVQSLTSGQYNITKKGRDTLTAFINAGFWKIPESTEDEQ